MLLETQLRLVAYINGHYYRIDFMSNGYREFCHHIIQLKLTGCPLSWIDLMRLRSAALKLIAEHERKHILGIK